MEITKQKHQLINTEVEHPIIDHNNPVTCLLVWSTTKLNEPQILISLQSYYTNFPFRKTETTHNNL